MQMRRSRPSSSVTRANVTATVKWFNPAKGFGFVQPTDGSADAFLHVSVVEQFGRRELPQGAVVECDLADGQRGQQVVAIHSVDESNAVAPSGFGMGGGGGGRRPPPGGGYDDDIATEALDGVVKFFNVEKGFGFIRPDDGSRDVFVSARTLTASGVSMLDSNQRVRVTVRNGDKGPMAASISLLS